MIRGVDALALQLGARWRCWRRRSSARHGRRCTRWCPLPWSLHPAPDGRTIDAEVLMGMRRRAHGVAGDTEAAIGAVLEAHQHLQRPLTSSRCTWDRWCDAPIAAQPSRSSKQASATSGCRTAGQRAGPGSSRCSISCRERRPSVMSPLPSSAGSYHQPLPAHHAVRFFDVGALSPAAAIAHPLVEARQALSVFEYGGHRRAGEQGGRMTTSRRRS